MAVEVIDLGDVAGMVCDVVRPLAQRNGIEFTCAIAPDVPLVRADFEKVRHVVENLCGNAMKFTSAGGSVRLGIECAPEGNEVLIHVADTGIGIAERDQRRIFERFVQADSSVSRQYSGTGLGLALAKEYVEMHGGSIDVESELGRGSVFTVRLPIRAKEA